MCLYAIKDVRRHYMRFGGLIGNETDKNKINRNNNRVCRQTDQTEQETHRIDEIEKKKKQEDILHEPSTFGGRQS